MMLKRLLRRDTRGIGAAEFALVAPVLIAFVIGISQMGKLFFANADMKNAMAHGARVASIWPVPDDAAILAAVNERLARSSGLDEAEVGIVRGTDDKGNDFLRIDMDYRVPLDFIFFDMAPITLRDSRQVFLQMEGAAPENDNSTTTGSTTTGGTTSATSSGDASTSTSTTSAGGTDTSTSSTSASSTGGTTTTTSASTTSSTTSSGNGNSNGNSSHGHGNCNKKC